ncbi:MAG TPA: creatininase family protein [Pseudonocardiaceae bacterium]|nr:creatininase family protein [Pseudonocardiaceae bacterium]
MQLLTAATSDEESARGAKVALLPIGSFEQHGDHLPLTTDTLVACIIAERLASAYNLFLLSPVTISCSHEHAGFSGTVSISARTLIATVEDIKSSLERAGIGRIVIVNGHGGNYVLSNIVQESNIVGPRMALFPGREDFVVAREHAEMVSTMSEDMHGGEWETSILLHTLPELVRPTYAKNDHDAPERPHLLITGMQGYTSNGIIGKPSAATAEKGKAALESLVESFAGTLDLLT